MLGLIKLFIRLFSPVRPQEPVVDTFVWYVLQLGVVLLVTKSTRKCSIYQYEPPPWIRPWLFTSHCHSSFELKIKHSTAFYVYWRYANEIGLNDAYSFDVAGDLPAFMSRYSEFLTLFQQRQDIIRALKELEYIASPSSSPLIIAGFVICLFVIIIIIIIIITTKLEKT